MDTALKQIAKKNMRLSLAIYTLSTVSTLTATGTLMQTFLATLGLPASWIYIHATVTQAVNVLTLLLTARWVKADNAIARNALATIPYGLLFLAVIPFCLRQSATPETFLWLIIIGALQATAIGLRTVCTYILPYILYSAEDYGPLQSVSGIVSSVVSLSLGGLVSFLTGRIAFSVLMTGACILSAGLTLLEAVLILQHRSILPQNTIPGQNRGKRSASLWETFRHPVFYTLALPALLRGFASGTTTVFAAMAFDLGFDETLTTNLLYLQSAAGLAGCGLIGFLSRRCSIRIPVLAGSLSFLLLPLFFLESGPIFMAAATAVILGRTLVDYGVPILLRRAVPIHIAGTYNAWRMVLHSGGTLLATSAAAVLTSEALIGITVVFSLLSGCGFFFSRAIRRAE